MTEEILTHQQAEEFVMKLKKFQISDLGGAEFFRQHQNIQQLNMQAHQNYSHDTEEWVSSLFDKHANWDVLVHNLIVCHAFRAQFLPGLLKDFPDQEDMKMKGSIFIYALLFHEAVMFDLLAVRAVDQLPETSLLPELIDYCTYRLE